MKPLPILTPITTPIRQLSPDFLRECELVAKRASAIAGTSQTPWTFDDATELSALQRRNSARQAASDRAHDEATEARSFPADRTNFHDL